MSHFGGQKIKTSTLLKDNSITLDKDINKFRTSLNNIKLKDLPPNLNKELNVLAKIIDKGNRKYINLIKLLYVLKYYNEVFLYLGILIEAELNKVAELYLANPNWVLSQTNKSKVTKTREILLNKFIENSPLNQKATDIKSWNIYNDITTSETISSRISGIRSLRNYGGHDKNISYFLNSLILKNKVNEIIQIIEIIKVMKIAKDTLQQNPPI